MKKIILILALIVMNNITIFSNPPNGVTFDQLPWRMIDFPPVDRDIPPYTPACSCSCADMIKAAEIMSTDEGEVYLRGGREYDGLICQEFRLLLSACNGAPITNFGLTFDYGNAQNESPCFDENQSFYKVNSSNNLESVGSITRPNGYNINISLGSDFIPACSSKIITFYVCTSEYCQFSRVNVSVDLSSADGCSSRSLIFQYDGITSIPKVNNNDPNLQGNNWKLKNIIDKYQIAVYDIYGNEIAKFINLSDDDFQVELANLKMKNGVYLIHKLNYDNKESIEKILINN